MNRTSPPSSSRAFKTKRPKDGLSEESQRRAVMRRLHRSERDCRPDQIVNPYSGRCVKASGPLGQALRAYAKQAAVQTRAGQNGRVNIQNGCPEGKVRNPVTRRCIKDPSRVRALRALAGDWNAARARNLGSPTSPTIPTTSANADCQQKLREAYAALDAMRSRMEEQETRERYNPSPSPSPSPVSNGFRISLNPVFNGFQASPVASHSPAPSFRASPSPAPSFRASPSPAPSFRASPSPSPVPSFRASPSPSPVASFRAASPSPSPRLNRKRSMTPPIRGPSKRTRRAAQPWGNFLVGEEYDRQMTRQTRQTRSRKRNQPEAVSAATLATRAAAPSRSASPKRARRAVTRSNFITGQEYNRQMTLAGAAARRVATDAANNAEWPPRSTYQAAYGRGR